MSIGALQVGDDVDLVRQVVAAICRAPLESLLPQTRPANVKGWDSFGRLQVVLELEQLLGRQLPLERAVAAGSIAEIADLIAEGRG